MKRYISVLLAVFVFVLGMLGGGTADAAKVTADEVSRLITVKPRNSNETKSAPIKMHVMLENIDLNAYAKYTAELRKNAKYGHIVFAKAAPGSQVSITAEAGAVPGIVSKVVRDLNYSETVNYYNHKKIETSKDLMPTGKVNGFGKKYTIPKDVEEVTAYVSVTYHVGFEVGKDMKSSTGTYRQEPAIARHYYIFTSDEACKKAYKLLTGKAAGSGSATKKTNVKTNKTNKQKKEEIQPEKTDDEAGGIGMIGKVGIGLAAAGAVGFGASRLRGGKGGGGGAGAGSGSAGAAQGKTMNNIPGSNRQNTPQGKAGNNDPGQARQNTAQTSQKFCTNCGAKLIPGSKFCTNCGTKL